MSKFVEFKLKTIKIWRWIIMILFLGVFTYNSLLESTTASASFSYIQFLLYTFNDGLILCWGILFVTIVFSADLYNSMNDEFNSLILISIGGRKKYFSGYIQYVFINSFILTLMFGFIATIVFALASNGNLATSDVTLETFLEAEGFSSGTALASSFVLVFLRIVLINSVILVININSNYPIGIIAPFFISVIDWWTYEIFQIMQPMGILPIEHTRLFYTEAVAPAFEAKQRLMGVGQSMRIRTTFGHGSHDIRPDLRIAFGQ